MAASLSADAATHYALTTFSDLLAEVRNHGPKKRHGASPDYVRVVHIDVFGASLLGNKLANSGCQLYAGGALRIHRTASESIFSPAQAISMIWDYAEVKPFLKNQRKKLHGS